MDQQATIRFHGGPSHPRTPRISKETWKKHEAAIRELFPTSTLRELMDVMETRHGFKATEKQYIHQLPKWGLHKRVVKQGAPTGRSPPHLSTERNPPQPTDPDGREGGGRDSPPSPFTTTPGTRTESTLSPPKYGFFQETPDSRLDLPPEAYTPRDYQPVVGGKRTRSIVSSASQGSARSVREWHKRSKVLAESPVASPVVSGTSGLTPSSWASPRAQYDHNLYSPDSYGGGVVGLESPWSPGTVFTSTGIPQDPPETPATAVSDTPDETLLPYHGLPLEPGFNDWKTPELHEALETAARLVFQKTLSHDPRIRVSKRHKLALRLSRLAETLFRRHEAAWSGAKETTRVLHSVAEYLQAVGLWTDAFYLYAFLLSAAEETEQQQQQQQQQQPEHGAGGQAAPWSLAALHLACAGAANTLEQSVMVRTWPASTPAAFYGYRRFLQHGVCADMYGRVSQPAEAELEATEAHRLLATAGGFGTRCVAGVRFGRNADLVAYSYLVRFGGVGGNPETPTFAGYDRFVHRIWEAPVHGTGADGDGRDPLADLRSVLRWCFRAVDPTAATDGDAVFSTFSEIDEANSAVAPAPDDLGPAALDPRALGLFHCLFDRWIQLRDSPSSEEVWLWTQTQERMGLAPTEFLAVLCEMITEAGSSGGGVGSERSPVSYTAFIEQLDALDALPDDALADRFLAHFCAREALRHRTDLPEKSLPSPPPSVRPDENDDDDDDDRAAALGSTNTTPVTNAGAEASPGPRMVDDDDARSRSVRSAFAPSYASSDMSSLRRMARRARHLVRNPADAAGPHDEPPSHLVRRPSLTVSELSERFSESMSIGSSSRPSAWAPWSRQRNSAPWDEWKPRLA